MNYTLEEIYILVGKDDKTTGLTFKVNSDAYQKYGRSIVAVIIYTQYEREEMDGKIKIRPFSSSGFLKVRYLGSDLDKEQIQELKSLGINSADIARLEYFTVPQKNTFHSAEKRSIKKIEIPMKAMSTRGDLAWMYGFKKKLLSDNIILTPDERIFYLACKYLLEPGAMTEDESEEAFSDENQLKEEIEYEYLYLKLMLGKVDDNEMKKLLSYLTSRKSERFEVLNKYLKQSGSSLKKLSIENKAQAAEMCDKVLRFQDLRLNVNGKVPIYLDLDRYLHVYMRHVEEMKVNDHFEHKDNFQWNEEDVLVVMQKVINGIDKDVQEFFEGKLGQRYSRYGRQSVYFEGDYYTLHIEPSGRISTFYKNGKAHEKQTDAID